MASVVGTWTFTSDWGCDGSVTGSWSQTFNADGTWTSSLGHTGRWFQVEGMVTFTFNNVANLVYASNLSGSWIAGIQGYTTSGGTKGCHGATKSTALVALTQTAQAPAKGFDPALGR
jgi:hypothetical protein